MLSLQSKRQFEPLWLRPQKSQVTYDEENIPASTGRLLLMYKAYKGFDGSFYFDDYFPSK